MTLVTNPYRDEALLDLINPKINNGKRIQTLTLTLRQNLQS